MNVILIAIDTLRADHLGCYGYRRDTSPGIDAIAARGVVCEQNIAPAIPTHPAFATLNSGQFSITHGIVAHGGQIPVPRTVPWLPALLQQAGYTTCAVDNLAPWHHGFGRGFEFYIDPASPRPLSIKCDNRTINHRALEWLRQNVNDRFFLFIHYWDPHTPYLPPRTYRNLFYEGDPTDPGNRSLDRLAEHPLGKVWLDTWFPKLAPGRGAAAKRKRITDAAYIEAMYDGEIRYCDEGIAQVVKAIDRLGLADNTLLVITSDHGEMMFRHGIFFDHHGLYEGSVHVPLIFRHPSLSPGRVPHLTAQVDVAPTILDLCELEVPAEMEGVSLAPLLRGADASPPHEFVVCQECTWQMKWALRTPRHKFILAREPDFYGTPMRELYDLERDPRELANIADAEPELAGRLEATLESWIADMMRKNGLTEDPLVKHGLTLGQGWKKERETRA